MKDLKLKINPLLPEVKKVVTSDEAKSIYLVMTNNTNIQTNNQSGNNNAVAGNNSFISIINKKTYWYGVCTGIIASFLVNLLSNFVYDLVK
jgi:hypothetical protein